jgi:hypothetical protein
MNYDTFWKCLLIAGKFTAFFISLYLFARFMAWKAIRDYETEKKRKTVGHIDLRG